MNNLLAFVFDFPTHPLRGKKNPETIEIPGFAYKCAAVKRVVRNEKRKRKVKTI